MTRASHEQIGLFLAYLREFRGLTNLRLLYCSLAACPSEARRHKMPRTLALLLCSRWNIYRAVFLPGQDVHVFNIEAL